MPRRTVMLALVLGLAAPAGANAATAVPIGVGYAANVAVDGAGTAYIAWNGGELPSTLRFCRLPRGATACDVTTTIAGAGDSLTRPFVSVSGDTVRLVQYRYGAAPGVYRYTSINGGASFDGGVVVGFPPFQDAVVGPGSTLSGITSAFQEGTVFQNVPLTGPNTDPFVRAVLSGPNDHPYNGTVGLLDGLPLAVFSNGSSFAQFRRYDGSGSTSEATNWTPAVDIGYADYPSLAGGRAGLFLLSGQADDSITARPFNGTTFGPAATVLARGEDVNSDLVQDFAGRLHAVVAGGELDGFHLVHATSDDGAAWRSGSLLVQTDGAIGQPRAAVASDHGGVAVWSTSIIIGPRAGTKEIRVAAIGPEAPPAGGGGPPGGATPPPAAPGPAALPPPVAGKSVNVLPKSGTVRIKRPGASRFSRLTGGQQVPVGTTVNTLTGRVTLVAAADKHGKTATADFYDGIFRLSQSKAGLPRGQSRPPRRSASRTAACASWSTACCGARPG